MNKFFRGIWLMIRYGPAKIVDWQEQSIYDALTGLYNRRFLLEAGKRELAKAKRSEKGGVKYPVSAILIDVDKLKRFNDEEGHAAGDEVLRRIASLLKKVCREVDVVCRISGDEFVVLLPETAIDGAKVMADRLQAAAKEMVSPKGNPISLSCGVAEAGKISLEVLLQKADEEMYKIKKGLKT